jgi:hypothetical protein
VSALRHLRRDDPVAGALMMAIRTGDVAALEALLAEDPGLANARIEARKPGSFRTPLHVAADWPGYFLNGPAVVRTLIAAGADPNLSGDGTRRSETPLHWAASSDDVAVAEALIDGGADLEAPGASIAGGTPLDNAVGYGCWQVARLLLSRGARVDKLWHAAALGLLPRLEAFFAGSPAPTAEEVNHAFWQACHGGQRRAAGYLLARGADPGWRPDYSHQSALEVAGSLDTARQQLVEWLRGLDAGAHSNEVERDS